MRLFALLDSNGHRLLQQHIDPGVDDLASGLGVQLGGKQNMDGVELPSESIAPSDV